MSFIGRINIGAFMPVTQLGLFPVGFILVVRPRMTGYFSPKGFLYKFSQRVWHVLIL